MEEGSHMTTSRLHPLRPTTATTDSTRKTTFAICMRWATSPEFKRDMSPWANFSLGFTYLSPVVGVYTLFAYALATGGPPMIWSF